MVELCTYTRFRAIVTLTPTAKAANATHGRNRLFLPSSRIFPFLRLGLKNNMRETDFRCFYKNGKNPDLDTNLRKISRNISRKGQNIFRKTDVLCDRKDLRAGPRQSRGIVQPPIVPELSPTTNRSILYLGRSRKRRSVSASRPAAVTTRPKPRARHKAIRRESNRRSSAKQSVRRRPFPANSCPHITLPG